MHDPLAGFEWATLYPRYDAQCSGFDKGSRHLAWFGDDRPQSDRELYYRLADYFAARNWGAEFNPVGIYESLLYWKLYSQLAARSRLGEWMTEGSAPRRSAEANFPRLPDALPAALGREVGAVVRAVRRFDEFRLPGAGSVSAIPVRTTILHFLYPETVPIFDRMVLRAVGVDQKGANQSYQVLAEYVPFAWQLAERHAVAAPGPWRERPLRLVDMALWVGRGA